MLVFTIFYYRSVYRYVMYIVLCATYRITFLLLYPLLLLLLFNAFSPSLSSDHKIILDNVSNFYFYYSRDEKTCISSDATWLFHTELEIARFDVMDVSVAVCDKHISIRRQFQLNWKIHFNFLSAAGDDYTTMLRRCTKLIEYRKSHIATRILLNDDKVENELIEFSADVAATTKSS